MKAKHFYKMLITMILITSFIPCATATTNKNNVINQKKELRMVQLEDLSRYKYLQDARLSPNGKSVIYNVSHIDAKKNIEFKTLWLLLLKTKKSRPLTSGSAINTKPRWSPDGKKIAFLSSSKRKNQIHIISVDGKDTQALTTMPQGVKSEPVWSPDGKLIAFACGPAQPAFNPHGPYRVTRKVYRSDGIGYVDNAVQDIYIIPVKGGDPQQLTKDKHNNTNPVWSPTGAEILFKTNHWADSDRDRPALRAVNLKGKVRDIVMSWGSARTAVFSQDGKRIVFIGNPIESPFGAQANLWVQDYPNGRPKCRTADLDLPVGGLVMADMPVGGLVDYRILLTEDGMSAIVRIQERGQMMSCLIALDGAESYTNLAEGIPLSTQGQRFLYAITTINDPLNIAIADIDGSDQLQLTHINDDLIKEFKKSTIERILYPSSGGVEIEGWIQKPPVGKAPYPTLLTIHGGPKIASGPVFSPEIQMLNGAGYAVLFVNYRGSEGYGKKFCKSIEGDPGNLDYIDIMAGVDHAVKIGLADPDRLGVYGLSYGGFMSTWIIGHTNRFKAAVPENPVTNWQSLYAISDIGAGFTPLMMGGKPHELPQAYTRCSPVTYAHNCTTPTLLIQGEADYRCPAEQSEQFYGVLKDNGCTVEMLRLPYMPHLGSLGGPIRVRYIQDKALLDWMNYYILGRR